MNEPVTDLGFAHRFVPSQVTGPGPTLLLLHGTGGNEDDLLPLGRALAPDAALLALRGRVLESGMPRFFRRLAEGVFDLEDLQARTHELADFVAAAASAYGLDPARVIAVGFSNGANIAAATLLLRPRTLAGAVLFRAMVPLVPEALPDLRGVPVLVSAGRLDRIAGPEQTRALARLLGEAGALVTMHSHEAGHTLTEGDIASARGWLAGVHLAAEAR
jgi:phospholipase/carboxylesterase